MSRVRWFCQLTAEHPYGTTSLFSLPLLGDLFFEIPFYFSNNRDIARSLHIFIYVYALFFDKRISVNHDE